MPADPRRTDAHRWPGRLLLLGLLALLGSVAGAEERVLGRLLEQGRSDWRVPGLAAAVVDRDGSETRWLLGRTAPEIGAEVDDATQFINASTTKAMVAAGLLMLVDEGRLSLDDRLVDHLPRIHFADPALTAQVTIRDLLTHRTGLPSTDFWTFNQGMPLPDQLPLLRAVEPVAPPRARKIYQNTMYELAGLVLESVAGEPWQDFLTTRLWGPIGMRSTWGTRDAIPAMNVRAEPFEVIDGEVRAVAHSLRGPVADAAGSVWSTLDDMVRWLRFILDGGVTAAGERLLSEERFADWFTPQQLVAEADYYPTAALTEPNWISYGLGWYQQDFQGRKIDYHTGSLNGAVALVGVDHARGRGIVFFANLGGAELRHAFLWAAMDDGDDDDRLAWHDAVFELYEDRSDRRSARREAIAAGRLDVPTSLPLDAYAGNYDSAAGGPLRVVAATDGLMLYTRVREYRLTPWHSDTFTVMHEDWSNPDYGRFLLTPDGRIEALEAFGFRFEREADDAAQD